MSNFILYWCILLGAIALALLAAKLSNKVLDHYEKKRSTR